MNKHLILSNLKQKGARLTNVRQNMVAIFSQTKTPLSAMDILQQLKKRKLTVNKTTVYRELTFLLQGKIITALALDREQKRYELLAEHHHHLICQNCRTVEEVDFPEIEKLLSSVEKKLKKKNKFSKILHSLEFFGVCSKCG